MLTEEQLRNAFCSTNSSEPLTEGWPGLERYGRAVEQIVIEQNRTKEKVQNDYNTISTHPLIGIVPEKIWKESRVFCLMECMVRKHDERSSSEEEYGIWMDELRRLLNEIHFMD